MATSLTNKKYLIIFIIASILFLPLLIYKLYQTEYKSIEATITTEKKRLKKISLLLQEEDEIQKKQEVYKRYLENTSKNKDQIMSNIKKEIDELAQANNISINSLKPVDKSGEPSIKIQLEGPFEDVISFFYSLNQSTCLLSIGQLRITSDRGSKTNKVRVDLDLVILLLDL
ncbi:MAG: hypothetical protein V1872_01230 [bacterium]